jgi:hypothetical protein
MHRDSTYATILDCLGRIVSQRRIGNDGVLSYLSNYKTDRIDVEASNQVASLYRLLEKNRYVVTISSEEDRVHSRGEDQKRPR